VVCRPLLIRRCEREESRIGESLLTLTATPICPCVCRACNAGRQGVSSRATDSSSNRLTLLRTARSTRREGGSCRVLIPRQQLLVYLFPVNIVLPIVPLSHSMEPVPIGGSILSVPLLDVCRVARCSSRAIISCRARKSPPLSGSAGSPSSKEGVQVLPDESGSVESVEGEFFAVDTVLSRAESLSAHSCPNTLPPGGTGISLTSLSPASSRKP